MKCQRCQGLVFFQPLSGRTLLYCGWRQEGVADIDLETGLSPAVQKYGQEEADCGKFIEDSNMRQSREHPLRTAGEKYLRRILESNDKNKNGVR